MKKEVILMSGDNQRTANAIAKETWYNKVLAQVSPESKALEIKKLTKPSKESSSCDGWRWNK